MNPQQSWRLALQYKKDIFRQRGYGNLGIFIGVFLLLFIALIFVVHLSRKDFEGAERTGGTLESLNDDLVRSFRQKGLTPLWTVLGRPLSNGLWRVTVIFQTQGPLDSLYKGPVMLSGQLLARTRDSVPPRPLSFVRTPQGVFKTSFDVRFRDVSLWEIRLWALPAAARADHPLYRFRRLLRLQEKKVVDNGFST